MEEEWFDSLFYVTTNEVPFFPAFKTSNTICRDTLSEMIEKVSLRKSDSPNSSSPKSNSTKYWFKVH